MIYLFISPKRTEVTKYKLFYRYVSKFFGFRYNFFDSVILLKGKLILLETILFFKFEVSINHQPFYSCS